MADVTPRTAETVTSWTEYTTSRDHYFNYCWWPYEPVAPIENKLRQVNLLFHSFEQGGLGEAAFRLVRTIRDAIGSFRTVWGTKWIGDRLAWEFYFYDYERRERELSITRVLEVIRGFARCGIRINENLAYFMFSIDIDRELLSGKGEIDLIHMYIGNPGSTVSSGIAYALRPETTALENFYFFFDAGKHLREVAEKICCSAHFDATSMDLRRVLVPELRDCRTICVANKQGNDTVYFSGVDVKQLLFFLKMLRYPPWIIAYVEENQAKLDHLLYDVGFDYVARDGEPVIVKSGYYGVF